MYTERQQVEIMAKAIKEIAAKERVSEATWHALSVRNCALLIEYAPANRADGLHLFATL